MFSEAFLYPVSVVSDQNGQSFICVLQQKSPDSLSLFFWDPGKDVSFRALSPAFIPAGFTLLPDKNGFSFIDNGRIRVKLFEKRSPRSLELYTPLTNITKVSWIDNETFYASAQKGKNYGIFQINIRGEVATIVLRDGVDCLYPCKVGKWLFYIERTKNYPSHRVVKVAYPLNLKENAFQSFQERIDALMSGDNEHEEYAVQEEDVQSVYEMKTNSPVIFLYMTSKNEGYFIKHSKKIDSKALAIRFFYYQIQRNAQTNVWKKTQLFSFLIPFHLLSPQSENRLYESILPFVPYHYLDSVYYSSSSSYEESCSLDIYCYSLSAKNITRKTFSHDGEYFFSPLVVGQKVFYGGTMEKIKTFFLDTELNKEI